MIDTSFQVRMYNVKAQALQVARSIETVNSCSFPATSFYHPWKSSTLEASRDDPLLKNWCPFMDYSPCDVSGFSCWWMILLLMDWWTILQNLHSCPVLGSPEPHPSCHHLWSHGSDVHQQTYVSTVTEPRHRVESSRSCETPNFFVNPNTTLLEDEKYIEIYDIHILRCA